MIDPDLLEGYPADQQDQIRRALMTLASTGVLMEQRQRLFARVAEGADNEDEKELVAKILSFRKQSHALLALHQQGESIRVEFENEQE